MDQTGDDTKTNWNVTLLVAALTFAGSMVGNYFVYQSDFNSLESSNLQAFMAAQLEVNNQQSKDIERLKKEADRWRAQFIQISLENMELTAQLRQKINERQIVTRWVEDLPYAAWAKKRNEEGQLEIININERFTSEFGLTKQKAIGFTDFELFDKKLATIYARDDEKVIATGVPLETTVDFAMPNGEVVKMKHVKYRIEFADGEYGVGGIVVD